MKILTVFLSLYSIACYLHKGNQFCQNNQYPVYFSLDIFTAMGCMYSDQHIIKLINCKLNSKE